MSNNSKIKVNISDWVQRVKNDPVTYLQRQAAEVTLNTIAMTSPLNKSLILKGGVLMGLAYDSPRQTSDIDLSYAVTFENDIDVRIKDMLDNAFPNVTARLGYVDIILKTHSVAKRPRVSEFENASYPALKLKIAYARKGSIAAKVIEANRPPNTIFEIDISFNEPMQHTQVLSLDGEADILAYSLGDLIAEKYRAMLQQVERNRYRRQDVFDLNHLLEHESAALIKKNEVLKSILIKSKSRKIEATVDSVDNPDVKQRSENDWDTMALEIGSLPDFNEAYEKVRLFYRSLPWS